jgi:hypothetical protein
MRLFGLDIRRIKKEDREEETRFKNVLNALDNTILSTLQLLSDYDLDDRELVVKLYYSVETIQTLVILYEDNKFSTPFTDVNLINLVNNLNNRTALLQQSVIKYYSIMDRSEARLQEMGLDEYDEEADEQVNEFRRLVEGLQGLIEKQIRVATRDLIAIKTCIQYDSLRVISGVDIVRFYYDNRKRCPKGKVEYQFKIMHQHPMKTRKED